jgi:hypothetical protein
VNEAAIAPRANGMTSAWCKLAPEQFWLRVDNILNAYGQPNALWLDELVHWYQAGLTVEATVQRVLAGRRVR